MAWAHTDFRSISKFTQVRQEARLAPKLRLFFDGGKINIAHLFLIFLQVEV